MGFHACEWCKNQPSPPYSAISPYSSQDITLEFDNGHVWEFPNTGLLHYIVVHDYKPPDEFIEDVIGRALVNTQMLQSKSLRVVTRVGYLVYPDIPTSVFISGFFMKRLLRLIGEASGEVRQTRGG